jgi:hypothetical protein
MKVSTKSRTSDIDKCIDGLEKRVQNVETKILTMMGAYNKILGLMKNKMITLEKRIKKLEEKK